MKGESENEGVPQRLKEKPVSWHLVTTTNWYHSHFSITIQLPQPQTIHSIPLSSDTTQQQQQQNHQQKPKNEKQKSR